MSKAAAATLDSTHQHAEITHLQAGVFDTQKPAICWRVAALTEPAFRRGKHCHLPLVVANYFAADESVLLEVLTKPESEGGKGFYKVLFYCDENSREERGAFSSRLTNLKRSFSGSSLGPDIEL